MRLHRIVLSGDLRSHRQSNPCWHGRIIDFKLTMMMVIFHEVGMLPKACFMMYALAMVKQKPSDINNFLHANCQFTNVVLPFLHSFGNQKRRKLYPLSLRSMFTQIAVD